MNRAAHFGLALDVDDVALAHPHGGSDAHRMGKAKVAEVDHGQAVDLADMAAARGDQQGVLEDRVLILVAQAVVAPGLGRQRRFDIDSADRGMAGPNGAMLRLVQQVGNVLRVGDSR